MKKNGFDFRFFYTDSDKQKTQRSDEAADFCSFTDKGDGTFDFDFDAEGLKGYVSEAVSSARETLGSVRERLVDIEKIIGSLNFQQEDDFDEFIDADSVVFDKEIFDRIKVRCTECCCTGYFRERDRIGRIFRNAFIKNNI